MLPYHASRWLLRRVNRVDRQAAILEFANEREFLGADEAALPLLPVLLIARAITVNESSAAGKGQRAIEPGHPGGSGRLCECRRGCE